MKFTEQISKKLNELLIKNYDAEKGYLNALENVDSPTLKMFFKRRATERSEFAKSLKLEILRYGESPKDTGSFTGLAHRNWMALKSLFSTNDEEAILEEAVRGEEASLKEYDEILKDKTLPPTIETMLLNQKQAIQSAINIKKIHEELVS